VRRRDLTVVFCECLRALFLTRRSADFVFGIVKAQISLRMGNSNESRANVNGWFWKKTISSRKFLGKMCCVGGKRFLAVFDGIEANLDESASRRD
jgi:hypothetical protein